MQSKQGSLNDRKFIMRKRQLTILGHIMRKYGLETYTLTIHIKYKRIQETVCGILKELMKMDSRIIKKRMIICQNYFE